MIFSTAIDLLIHTHGLLGKHTELLSSTPPACRQQKRALWAQTLPTPNTITLRNKIRQERAYGFHVCLPDRDQKAAARLPPSATAEQLPSEVVCSEQAHRASPCQTAPSPPPASQKNKLQFNRQLPDERKTLRLEQSMQLTGLKRAWGFLSNGNNRVLSALAPAPVHYRQGKVVFSGCLRISRQRLALSHSVLTPLQKSKNRFWLPSSGEGDGSLPPQGGIPTSSLRNHSQKEPFLLRN